MNTKKKFWRVLATLSLGAILGACGNAGGASDNDSLYIFNTKSEIGEDLNKLAKDYEAETGQSLKIFSPGSGSDITETMNTEMTSKNPPAIFSTNSLIQWGPKDGDFMYNLADSSNEELVKLAEQIPENQRLKVEDTENFGIPYTVEGYGYVMDTQLLKELFGLEDAAELVKDLKVVDYDAFRQFTDVVDAFIHNQTGQTVELNGHRYTTVTEKTELTKQLTGVFVEAGAEKWTYSDHMINIPMNTVYENYSDALYSEVDKMDTIKSALVKMMEVLEYNTAHAAGENSANTRGPEFINTTTGSYDYSLQLFADHRGLFIKQGNWIYPNLKKLNVAIVATLDMIPIKMPFKDSDIHLKNRTAKEFNTTIPTFIPNYWIINKNVSDSQKEAAGKFLVWLYTSERGLKFLKEESGFIMYNDPTATDSPNSLNNAIVQYLEGDTLSNPFNASPGNFLEEVGNELKENYMTQNKWDVKTYPAFADKVIKRWKELKDASK
ncbi:carbohydrate ABC transporter substrate-binding protein [Streptococcus cuniculi]|uniref:Carbohydrate ABC transporter substrate-binding protein n=1 Tax=Streptococcus cuniculi TaxID=1432788 RepID=A0A4Y9JAX3_9STRE|nr:carbohydrate ABC transporter substrate-binding protein [Streptococcus cuniculi]MBF0778398.1 carbohydrate ABC transporter substrate-binding protein [Streptococcus cuniculi]TFU97681.1 carbohydrate ABC transporter substrate-binding protein [Streptococcus cuniculi]